MFLILFFAAFVGASSLPTRAQDQIQSKTCFDAFSLELSAYIDSSRQNDPIGKVISEQKVKDTIFDPKALDAYEFRLKEIDALAERAEKAKDQITLNALIELSRDLQLRWLLSYADSFFNLEKQNQRASDQQFKLKAAIGIALTMALLKVKANKVPALLAWMRRLRSPVTIAMGSTSTLASDRSIQNNSSDTLMKIPEAPAEILRFGYRDLREDSKTQSLSLISRDERLILLELAVDSAGWGASTAVAVAWARRVNTAATVTKWNPYVLGGTIVLGLATGQIIPQVAEAVDETRLQQRFSAALKDWNEKSRQGKRWHRWKAGRELSDSAIALHRFWAQKGIETLQKEQPEEEPSSNDSAYFETLQSALPKKIAEVPSGIFSFLNQKKAYAFWLNLPHRSWEMSLSHSLPSDLLVAQTTLLMGWRRWKSLSQTQSSQSMYCSNESSPNSILEQAQSYAQEVKRELILRFIKKCEKHCPFSDGISPLVFVASIFELQGDPYEVTESERLLTLAYQWSELNKYLK